MTASVRIPVARYAGLDGLRALAVTLVVVYHLFPAVGLRSGFIGVDVFFVISGFLITSLLLREREERGRIGLRDFWRRRARRLLPALALLLPVCAALAWLVGGDVLWGLGAQLLGAATFSYNWVAVAAGADYFSGTAPELFRNLWSLAVEEQFYLLWPLLFPLVFALRSRTARVALALLLASASAAWAGMVAISGEDLTRAYFGTDTHAFGLLIGIALAFAARRTGSSAVPAWALRPIVRHGSGIVGIAAILGIVALAGIAPAMDAAAYPGAPVAASGLTAVAIAAAIWPASWLGPALDVPGVRWIGVRSYGIYLWHWPVLILLSSAVSNSAASIAPASETMIGVLALAVTLPVAAASFRWIETPVRRDGFRRTLARFGGAVAGPPRRRPHALGALTVAVLALGGTAGALAEPPAQTSAERFIRTGEEALQQADDLAAPDVATPTASPTPTPRPLPPGALPELPARAVEPAVGDQITAVGDSVMLASAGPLLERFPGISVNAKVSRQMTAGPGILRKLETAGKLRPYVVVALGTNGPIDRSSLKRMARIAGPDRALILVTASAPRDWIPGVNRDLRAFAEEHQNVVIADWHDAIDGETALLAGDRIHPGHEGGVLFAETVADALDDAAELRADRTHRDATADWLRAVVRRISSQSVSPEIR